MNRRDFDPRRAASERHSHPFVDSYLELEAVPASAYSMDALVDIYNQTRVDYIVPMPMNAKRLGEYIDAYDINLDASLVVQARDGLLLGISMLGLRDDRAWITRLGVLPVKRRRGTGRFIMDHHLYMAKGYGAHQIQLEVIKGNEPAHNLFRKKGFLDTRELLVIRRPPGAPQTDHDGPSGHYSEMTSDEIVSVLEERDYDIAWTEEYFTFNNIDGVRGLRLELDSGEVGHLVYQQSAFQFSHLVLCSEARRNLGLAAGLLFHFHQSDPLLDTKVENLALDDPLWPVYQYMGYVEVFRRIEMLHFVDSGLPQANHH
jgi:ribosomal protein S18 acetylase RimI-like enzyme